MRYRSDLNGKQRDRHLKQLRRGARIRHKKELRRRHGHPRRRIPPPFPTYC